MSTVDQFLELSNTPYPAWAFTSALAVTPMLSKTPQLQTIPAASSSSWFKSSNAATGTTTKLFSPYPTNISILLFGGMSALGGFMIYDNDVANGSAVVSSWSFLYTLVNSKKSILSWRFYPKALTLISLGNAGLYGGKFFGFY